MQHHSYFLLLALLFASPLLVMSAGAAHGPYAVVERGPHHALWQRLTAHTTSYGRTFYTTNGYYEIGTGKFHKRGDQWFPSVAEITVLPSGFGVATQLQHKVIFAPNINTAGAIDCLTPDDKRLRSHVLGLAYTDRRTGQGVMIAEIKDSTGVLVANNQVLYPDAFDTEGGFRADIRYTVTLAGLEQDIILVESPPDPLIYGIDPENCRLEVYSEFVDFAEPTKKGLVLKDERNARARQAMVEPDLVDERLNFGQMRMEQGAAFRFDDPETSIPMGKTWEQREGRQLLVERADYSDIQGELARLPQVALIQNPKKPVLLKVGRAILGEPQWASFLPARPPATHAAVRRLRTREMAQATIPRQGFVLDWQLLTTQTDFTFKGDLTYYVSGVVTLSGTTTIEGGAVIKYTNASTGARVTFGGPIACNTSHSRPAIFTSIYDHSVGEVVGDIGTIPTNTYAARAMDIGAAGSYDLHDLCFRYIERGIYINISGVTLDISHSSFGLGNLAFFNPFHRVNVRNVLFHDMKQVTTSGGTNALEQITCHRVGILKGTGAGGLVSVTNSMLICVTNGLSFVGENVVTNLSDSGLFQTAGYGQRYLAASSPYRNAGTTNINATLLAALRQRTTYPPMLLTNDITVNTTLTPQAQRDTDAIDLGYHYLPTDWIVSGISVTNATLTVSGGAAVAMDAANTNWGIRLQSGGALISEGDPVNLNRFVRTHSVQEVPAGVGNDTAPLFADIHPPPTVPAVIKLRFSDVAQIQKHYAFKQQNNQGTLNTLIVHDSHFRGGTNSLSPNNTNQFMGFTNVVFDQASLWIYPYGATTLRIGNCTFKSGWLGLHARIDGDWRVQNNIFDYTAFFQEGLGTLTNDYNGYLTNAARLTPNGANDVVLATNTVNFQTGPLGSFYLPSTSGYIDKGSVTNAGFVGLWHYTTQTNQTKDAATRLDLGFHYVAVGSNNQPIDSDADGTPDYAEDGNGDGDLDSGETNHNNASDAGLKVLITRPRNGSIIP